MKNCIVYIPYKLDPTAARARMVRPRKMIQAFEDNGYQPFVISGHTDERKARIKEVKQKIRSKVIFDFIYVEASTMPMLLTDPHHYPLHPTLDVGFFRFAKRHGIRIGLFYPDIYWKFDNYGEELQSWKRFFAIKNYELDLKIYEKYLDRFYIPNKKMCKYLKSDALTAISDELPPGSDDLFIDSQTYEHRDFSKEPLTVFYVGGLGNQYQIREIVKAVGLTDHARMILCCREDEWEKEKGNFKEILSDKIEVIHKHGEELEPYYRQTDLCSLLFEKSVYIDLAKPVKAYEYLAHEKPVLVTKGIEFADFVVSNNIGWEVNNSAEEISNLLTHLIDCPDELEEKMECCKDAKHKNTWMQRANKVAKDLSIQ